MQGASRLATRIKSDNTRGIISIDNDVEVKAIVQSFPASLIGAWRVGGVTYTTVPSTSFEQMDGPFAVGACVEVKTAIGSVVARSIKTEDSIECGPNAGTIARARGMLTAFPSSMIGACVEVHYLVSDVNRTATEVETESLDGCSRSPLITPTLETRGVISARPPTSTLFGAWLIGGIPYQAVTPFSRTCPARIGSLHGLA